MVCSGGSGRTDFLSHSGSLICTPLSCILCRWGQGHPFQAPGILCVFIYPSSLIVTVHFSEMALPSKACGHGCSPPIPSSGVKERAFPLPVSAVLRPRWLHTEINFMAGSCSAATATCTTALDVWWSGNSSV